MIRGRNLSLSPNLSMLLQDFVIEAPFWVVVALWLVLYTVVGLFFAVVYSSKSQLIGPSGNRDFLDAVHLSFVTQATVGYGDLLPRGGLRLVAAFQAVIGTGLNGLALGLITTKLLRRPSPIRFPKTVCFNPSEPIGGEGLLWLRYINVDSSGLADCRLTLEFHKPLTRETEANTYDTSVCVIDLPTPEVHFVSRLRVMALKINARMQGNNFGSLSIRDTIPFSPADFLNEAGGVDKSARLILTITGTISRVGDKFSNSIEYFAGDIVCGAFAGIDNNQFDGLTWREKVRRITPRFEAIEPCSERCKGCQTLVRCPFGNASTGAA